MGAGISWGVYFATYNRAKNFVRRELNLTDSQLTPMHHAMAAACSGLVSTIAVNPISMVKIRMQLQGRGACVCQSSLSLSNLRVFIVSTLSEVTDQSRMYRGVTHALMTIVRNEGFFALYRGLGPSILLISNGTIQLTVYEQLKRLSQSLHLDLDDKQSKQFTSAEFMTMGGMSKMISTLITYPVTVVRSRLYQQRPDAAHTGEAQQSSNSSSSSNSNAKYRSIGDALRKIAVHEGPRGFYRGLTVQLIKTTPASAITFAVYEQTVRFFCVPNEDR